MGAFKSLTTSDLTVVPFIVNKSFTFVGSSSLEDPTAGIDRLIGTNISNLSPFTLSTEPTTGNMGTYYQRDIYSSIKQLYYTNYIPNPISSSLLEYQTSQVGEGFNILAFDYTTSNVYSRFYNYESTTLSQSRYFPTESGAQIGVISIPSKLFGEYINPNTFEYSIQQYNYLPDVFLSTSLITTLIKDDNNVISITNNNPYITWSENTDSLGWFNSGELTLLNNISFPIDLYVEITASNPSFATDITILVCTGSNYTDSISSHTLSSFPSNYEFVVSLDETYIGNGQTISLFPLFNNSAPSNASVDLNIKMRMYKSSIPPLKIKDDGEGLIYKSGSLNYVGIINYSHGTVVITSDDVDPDFTSSGNVTCSFQSSRTIFETQYRCTLRENEFNFSQNPSIISGSGFTNPLNTTCSIDQRGIVYDFVTGSCFEPYVTSVGLYNERQELLAVAKLAQPLPTSRTTDMTIVINLDMF